VKGVKNRVINNTIPRQTSCGHTHNAIGQLKVYPTPHTGLLGRYTTCGLGLLYIMNLPPGRPRHAVFFLQAPRTPFLFGPRSTYRNTLTKNCKLPQEGTVRESW